MKSVKGVSLLSRELRSSDPLVSIFFHLNPLRLSLKESPLHQGNCFNNQRMALWKPRAEKKSFRLRAKEYYKFSKQCTFIQRRTKSK